MSRTSKTRRALELAAFLARPTIMYRRFHEDFNDVPLFHVFDILFDL